MRYKRLSIVCRCCCRTNLLRNIIISQHWVHKRQSTFNNSHQKLITNKIRTGLIMDLHRLTVSYSTFLTANGKKTSAEIVIWSGVTYYWWYRRPADAEPANADICKKKQHIAVNGCSISPLRDVTCHMGSHSVTCHPIQVNTSRINPSQ